MLTLYLLCAWLLAAFHSSSCESEYDRNFNLMSVNDCREISMRFEETLIFSWDSNTGYCPGSLSSPCLVTLTSKADDNRFCIVALDFNITNCDTFVAYTTTSYEGEWNEEKSGCSLSPTSRWCTKSSTVTIELSTPTPCGSKDSFKLKITSEDDNNPAAIIIGVVVASVVIIIVSIIVCCCKCRASKRRARSQNVGTVVNVDHYAYPSSSVVASSSQSTASQQMSSVSGDMPSQVYSYNGYAYPSINSQPPSGLNSQPPSGFLPPPPAYQESWRSHLSADESRKPTT